MKWIWCNVMECAALLSIILTCIADVLAIQTIRKISIYQCRVKHHSGRYTTPFGQAAAWGFMAFSGWFGWMIAFPIAARFERWTTQFKDTNNRVLMLPREWRNVRLCFASGKILRWSNKNLVRCRIACLEEHFKAQWEEWKWQAAFILQSTCSQPFASNGIRSFNVEKSNFT